MKILVTGAAGFLGLNVLRQMADAHRSATIIAADMTLPSMEDRARVRPVQNSIDYQLLDVRDQDACRRLMQSVRPTHVLHAAAVTLSDENATSVDPTHSVNVEGTRNVLEGALAARSVARCLLVSSSGVYKQIPDGSPCDEDHPLDLTGSYARAKYDAEMMMAEYEPRGGFPVLAARVGPVYGAFERSRVSRPNVSMIQNLLGALATGRTARVAGPDVHRDWTHAADIAVALDGLLLSCNLNHRIYNVSAGIAVSMGEILEVFVEYGLKVLWTRNTRDVDICLSERDNRKPLDITRLRKDTGFVPRYDLRAGLDEVITTHAQCSIA